MATTDTTSLKKKTDTLQSTIFSLLSISGLCSNGQNVISWKTDSRSRFTNFVLERSTDKAEFATIGQVAPFGTDKTNSFSYVDANPVAGRNFYRLRMTDSIGNSTYSTIISIAFALAGNLQIHFDSQSGTLGLAGMESGSDYQLKVYNCNGQPLLQKTVTTSATSISISQLPHGLYVVYVSHGGMVTVSRKIIW